ncbi:DUF6894 family protein [Methylobacterium segetis]|uniref:DUF6894 family protein n=1 Tax=Methylobacterium segetis TaxID=2488750 RepID=UPI00104B1BAE|nr:hypothetical protein [Methylobacterium segetis]
MPRFYFHLRTPDGLVPDDTGLDLVGIEAAYLDACRSIPAMAAELLQRRVDPSRHGFEITDRGGQILMEIPFTEIARANPAPARPAGADWRAAKAGQQRTADLTASIQETERALLATLRETRALLDRAREVSDRGCGLVQA